MAYNLNELVVTIDGRILKGYAVDKFITIARDETKPVGITRDIHGHADYSKYVEVKPFSAAATDEEAKLLC